MYSGIRCFLRGSLQIGRGMRLSPRTGKQDCHVIDFVDSTDRVVGIVNAPTLLGLDPEAALDGTSGSFDLATQTR